MDKDSKRAIIVVLAIMCAIAIVIIYSLTHPDPVQLKPTDSCGMFDGATKLEITFDNKEYEITSEDVIDDIVLLCREEWDEPTSTIAKEDCEMFVRFCDAWGSLWVDTDTLNAFMNTTAVSIDSSIVELIKANMVPVR